MALFNHLFPYSNLHDINLDWIISIIKSIDPAVIQALQQLTPDIIEQVNQKVSEAQAAAISAQSSASEANTARENAETSAAEAVTNATTASADAVRAETAANNAESAVETALTPVPLTATFADFVTVSQQNMWRFGGLTYFMALGTFNRTPTTPDYPEVIRFPTGVGQTNQTMPIIISTPEITDITVLGVGSGKADMYRGYIKTSGTFITFGMLR